MSDQEPPQSEDTFDSDTRWTGLLKQLERNTPPPEASILSRLREQTLGRYVASSHPERTSRSYLRRPSVRWAGVAIAAATLIGFAFFFLAVHTKPAYGMADLPHLLVTAKTLHTQSIRFSYAPDQQFPAFQKATMLPLETWIDLPNDRRRNISFMAWTAQGSPEQHLEGSETICDGPIQMDINSSRKRVTYQKNALLDQRLTSRHLLHQSLNLVSTDDLGSYTKVGEERLDGKLFNIWERIHQGTNHRAAKNGKGDEIFHYTMRVKCWLAPDDGQIGRIEQWVKDDTTGQWRPELFELKVERDVAIPAEIFALKAPEGYELVNTLDKPIVHPVSTRWGSFIAEAGVRAYVGLTLEDGSVIIGWAAEPRQKENPDEQKLPEAEQEKLRQARIREVAQQQEPLFAHLQAGGKLPELPAVLQSLRSYTQPYGPGPEATYSGYHLAFTRYEGRFIEWSLYVPDQKPPAANRWVYITRWLVTAAASGKGEVREFNSIYADPIVGKQEFDTFVLGSMAERSDTGIAPQLSYDRVIRLSSELRQRQGKP